MRNVDPRRRTSVSTRLALAILVVSITTILVSVAASSESVTSSAEELTEQRVATRAATTAADLTAYFDGLSRNLRLLGRSPAVGELADGLIASYRELGSTGTGMLESEEERLAEFYLGDFLPQLADVRGQPVDPLAFVPTDNPAAVALQSAYVAGNPFSADERQLLTDAGDGSAWTEVHEQAHPALRDITERLGFRDLMIVDAQSQSIVYSVDKDVAFATSLAGGPHSGTSLAGLVRQVASEPSLGEIRVADVAVYPPSGDEPTAFLATPVDAPGAVTAVLVGAVSFDEVTDIVSEFWRDGNAGDTGEMYLVGPDRRMRSDSRLLVEDPSTYFEQIDEAGTVDGIDRSRMEQLDTTVVFQPVETDAVQRGLEGREGTLRSLNYLGREVLSSFTPIAQDTFGWVLIAEQEVTEADAAATGYIRGTLVVTVVFVVALTFAAVGWANGFMAPVRAMSRSLARIRAGDDTAEIPIGGATEFQDLARKLDEMVQRLRRRRAGVLRALEDKSAVIRTLMPVTAADRVDLGRRDLVETVPRASVGAIVLRGLDEIVHGAGHDESRALLHDLLERLDRTAEQHQLERVKFRGNVYYAVAGLSGLVIDDAPRAVAFADAAIAEIEQLAGSGLALGAGAGVASGSVSTGLVGNSGLVFDVWGTPVDGAAALAHAAADSQVLIDRQARDRLAAGIEVVPVETAAGPVWARAGVADTRRTR